MATSFSALNWKKNGHHIRVYSSMSSRIVERCYDANQWYTGGYSGTGESVSGTACIGDDDIEHVRVYAVPGGNVTEKCWNGDHGAWVPGSFSAPGIGVAAASWISTDITKAIYTHYRVYVIGADHRLTEYWWDGDRWSPGELSLDNIAGVASTAWITSSGGSNVDAEVSGYAAGAAYLQDYFASVHNLQAHIRVYVRQRDNKIVEYYYDGGWKKGAFPAVEAVDHAVASYTKGESGRDQVSLRVYTVDSDHRLVEHCYDGGDWYIGELSVGGVDSVSATAWTTGDNDATHLRVYTRQSFDNRIVERYWDGEWKDGAYTPA